MREVRLAGKSRVWILLFNVRAIDTFTLSAEESARKDGSFLELDYSIRNAGTTTFECIRQ